MTRARVQLLGRLVADPELSFTPTGEEVASFELATSPLGPAAIEEGGPRHRCVAWNQGSRWLAALVVDHLHAGAGGYVEGQLQGRPGAESGREPGQADGRLVLVSDVQLLENPAMRERCPLRDVNSKG